MPTIYQGFARILQYGNARHKAIVRDIQASAIYLKLDNLGTNSGECGVDVPASTQQLIYKGPISLIRAFGEIKLSVHFNTAQTFAGLEGTLVHETRHAFHMARAIHEMSYGRNNYFNPNGFEIEYSAHVAYVEYIQQAVKLNHPDKQILVNEAVNTLGVAKKVGNSVVVDEVGLRSRLSAKPYYVQDTNRQSMGTTFSDHWKIYPKISILGGATGKIGI